MARIVKKFGGTSVADLECMRRAARRIGAAVERGDQVVAVVSAMGSETDRLVALARQTGGRSGNPERDNVLAAGEQVSAGLLTLVLQQNGLAARSWLGWQIPLRTDGNSGSARIVDIEATGLERSLARGEVPVIAGFQGLGPDSRLTTIGRGGTDTTAVAVAAALGADRCDIYTDVEGVFTADPRIVAGARKLDRIAYDEMLEMAALGARVMQTRSVELAKKYRIPVRVLSSFTDTQGTMLVDEDELVEQRIVSGITCSTDEAQITLVHLADRPGTAARIFGPLADAGINVDMIVQTVSENGTATDMTFTVVEDDLEQALESLTAAHPDIGYSDIDSDSDVAKLSIVGLGMRSHTGIAQTMFAALAEKGINIKVISTSEIKVSVLIAAEYAELAVRALHAAYGLDDHAD